MSGNIPLLMVSSLTLSLNIAFLLETDTLAWYLDPSGAGISVRVVNYDGGC